MSKLRSDQIEAKHHLLDTPGRILMKKALLFILQPFLSPATHLLRRLLATLVNWESYQAYGRKINGLLHEQPELHREVRGNASYKREALEFIQEQLHSRSDVRWHLFYAGATGKLEPHFIPEDFFYGYLEKQLNDPLLASFFSDKNLYDYLFADCKRPQTILRRIGGQLCDVDYLPVEMSAARQRLLMSGESEVVYKPARQTGGKGVIVDSPEIIVAHLSRQDDWIIQTKVDQVDCLSKAYGHSVNTIRCMTVHLDDGPKMISAVLRMGSGNSRVDNLSSGGVCAGITPQGRLQATARDRYGTQHATHPDTHVAFNSVVIPQFSKVISFCTDRHARLPFLKLISWDVAIDRAENVVLIEVNVQEQGINLHQMANGPLFGDLTPAVLATWSDRLQTRASGRGRTR